MKAKTSLVLFATIAAGALILAVAQLQPSLALSANGGQKQPASLETIFSTLNGKTPNEVYEEIDRLTDSEYQTLLNSIKPRFSAAPPFRCTPDMGTRLCELLSRSSANGVVEPWEFCFNEPIDAGCPAATFCDAYSGRCQSSQGPCFLDQARQNFERGG
ncbi:hypothetical protein CSUB_C0202 [Candidatus Caldarchaeum subterraneum]|uniref:Uncharacterized protein n=1 Tax=Caldiarchaeum subterraneum TaxID=311458 RepID=E6N4I1_CALS0|nr:hypothetical protein HGMM_F15C07C17 [Candidatus Caldarchaeum subterraneum]BAJ50063.1 hypothetical protein CSUB_C0202 [Candidatus Caldarchaeum subterraneum]